MASTRASSSSSGWVRGGFEANGEGESKGRGTRDGDKANGEGQVKDSGARTKGRGRAQKGEGSVASDVLARAELAGCWCWQALKVLGLRFQQCDYLV